MCHLRRALPVLVVVSFLSVMASAHAEVAGIMEEIVVQAQKREQNIQDVGISITAFSGGQMDSLGWTDSEDVAAQTPGLLATSFSADSTISMFSMRGVSQTDFAENQEAPVAIYVDEAYVSSPGAAGFQMYDLERVEILRGPQGTLFGRNATGGLLHFISKKPTEEFEGYAKVTLADYNQRRLEGAISGSITNNLRGRLSAVSNQHDGYVENRIGPDVREDDSFSFRGQLLYAVSDNKELLLNIHGNIQDSPNGGAYQYRASQVDADGFGQFCSGCGFFLDHDGDGVFDDDDGDGDDLAGAYDRVGFVDKEAYGATAKFTVEADKFTFTSVSDYLTINKNYLEDSDSTFVDEWYFFSGADITQFSQEVRFNGQTEKMRWVTGAYFLDIANDFVGGFPSPAFEYDVGYEASLDTQTWSVFGQLEYDIRDNLTLIAGLRWTDDKKDMGYRMAVCNEPSGSFCPVGGVPAASTDALFGFLVDGIPRSFSREDSDYSGKIQLDWRVDDETLVYAGISRGLKGGGFNAPLDGFLFDSEVPFKPEVLTSYEIGYKSEFLAKKAYLNLSGFYYDYSDFQAFVFEGNTSYVLNKEAKIYGGEIELVLAPGRNWEFRIGISAMDATVSDIVVNGLSYEQDIILAPNLTWSALGRKEWQFDNGATFMAQIDANYVDETQFNTINHGTTLGPDYILTNFRAVLSSANDRWDLGIFAKNLTDERYRVFGYDISSFDNFSMLTFGPPRWVGADFTIRF